MSKTWADYGIDIAGKTGIEVKALCPQCSHTRKKSRYPCLAVNLEKGVWLCWHCDWAGSLSHGQDRRSSPSAPPIIYRKPIYRATTLPQRVLAWFATRGIPEHVLARHRISYGPVYMPQLERETGTIQFPYFRDGEVVNVKYRDGYKYFRLVGGAERLLYGWDDVQGDTVLICEGEMDKLALEVAGYTSCVSVPDGAPPVATKNYEHKFDYLATAEDLLRPLRRIVLAVDNDPPGRRLEEELARRLGPERCWRVEWSAECKDANDVLMSYGPDVLRECIAHAVPWPIKGIVTVDMLRVGMAQIYARGMERGLSPGWPSLAQHYTVRPGELTIVCGVPHHGKTPWLSAVCLNLAQEQGWRISIFSPESYPLERYATLLLGQHLGVSFEGLERMERERRDAAEAWLHDHVSFLMPDEDSSPTVETLLTLAKTQVLRQGIKGLVLDPWSEIDLVTTLTTQVQMSEHIGRMLTMIRKFARTHGVHVWVVAHPTKLRKAERGEFAGKYPPPTPYDVNGSAHFRNKADNCITVWRDEDTTPDQYEIYIQKVRYHEIGRIGHVSLRMDRTTGQFREPSYEDHAWQERTA